MRRSSAPASVSGVSKITLPLAMKVATLAKPRLAKCRRRSSIFTTCPPTLMARSKAIYRDMAGGWPTKSLLMSPPARTRRGAAVVCGGRPLALGGAGDFHGPARVDPGPGARIGRLQAEGGDDRSDLRAMLHRVTGRLDQQVGQLILDRFLRKHLDHHRVVARRQGQL